LAQAKLAFYVWSRYFPDSTRGNIGYVAGCSCPSTGRPIERPVQHEIATDWIAAYRKYVGPIPTSGRRLSYNAEAPRESGSPRNQDDLNSSSALKMDKVWVNTR
jgi:hypothetical protein